MAGLLESVCEAMRLALVAAAALVSACGSSGAVRGERSPCAPHACHTRAAETLPFTEPPPAAPRGFHCLAPGTPERDPSGGECRVDERACLELAAHLLRSYGRTGRGRCTAHGAAWCFEQLSWGRRMEICFSSAASCEARRSVQVSDDRVSEITPACKRR